MNDIKETCRRRSFLKVQSVCRHRVKPPYAIHIVPIMELARDIQGGGGVVVSVFDKQED